MSARLRNLLDRAALFVRRSGLRCYVLCGWPTDPCHTPKRHAMGFQCVDCLKSGGGYDDFGYEGYVEPVRRVFECGGAGRAEAVTRTSKWEVSEWRQTW